jgi:hypothetical protein
MRMVTRCQHSHFFFPFFHGISSLVHVIARAEGPWQSVPTNMRIAAPVCALARNDKL